MQTMIMKNLIAAGLLFFAVGIFAAPVFAEDYEYQTTHESPEWSGMDHRQMLDATQIKQDDLEEMDTTTLLNAVLDYPLLVDIFMFNSLEQGVDIVRSGFNGMDELLTRNDLGQAILNVYGPLSLQRNGTVGIRLMALDAMLSSSAVFDVMSEAQKEEIAGIMAQSVSLGGDRHLVDRGSGIDQLVMSATARASAPNVAQVYNAERGRLCIPLYPLIAILSKDEELYC
jgi:hypothetical protein